MPERRHNFNGSLRRSNGAADMPFWEEAYRKLFPTMAVMVDHRQDGEHQRVGIDRSLTLRNSKQVLVDEKVRFRNEKTGRVYEDIALEYLSDRDRRVPGWVCKPLRADYIAYAIAPLGRCYLLPVIQLQKAWSVNSGTWLRKYRTIDADNETDGRLWTTLSVCVPVDAVYQALTRAAVADFTPYDDGPPDRERRRREEERRAEEERIAEWYRQQDTY